MTLNPPWTRPRGFRAEQAEQAEALGWEEVVSQVEERLEAMRRRELRRFAGGLGGLTKEQRALVDDLTRGLVHDAVVVRLRAAAGRSPASDAEEINAVREMFPAA